MEEGNWRQGTGGRELEEGNWRQGAGGRELEAGNWGKELQPGSGEGTGGREEGKLDQPSKSIPQIGGVLDVSYFG